MYVQIYPALKIQCYTPIPVYVHLLDKLMDKLMENPNNSYVCTNLSGP